MNNKELQVALSVVVPVYNERDSLKTLHMKLESVLQTLGRRYEIVFVDDGSTDDSITALRELASSDPRVIVIEFRRNFGKAAALSSGFKYARGEIIITLDADLQDDPQDIPRFLDKLDEGYDLVSGWKRERYDPFAKRLQSMLANRIINMVTGLSLHDINCGFKAYRSEAAKSVRIYGQLHRYIPVLANQYGFRIGEIIVTHHARSFGWSKYNIFNRWASLLDLATVAFLTQFDRTPLHFLGGIGAFFSASGFVICLYLTWVKLVEHQLIGNRPLLTLGFMLILIGLQFFSFGLLADMMIHLINPSRDSGEHIRTIVRQTMAEPESKQNPSS